jgi:hypothetical protein
MGSRILSDPVVIPIVLHPDYVFGSHPEFKVKSIILIDI